MIPALVLAALAYTGGTVAAAALGGPWWFSAALAALLAAALVARWPRMLLPALAAVFLASAAHARFDTVDAQPASPLAALAGLHEVTGVLRDDPRLTGSLVRFDLEVEAVDGVALEGGLRVTAHAPLVPLRGGERVSVVGALDAPPEIPDFDYAAYLRARGIDVVMRYPRSLERLGIVDRGVVDLLAGLRRWTVDNIERSLPEPASALAAGVLIGERRSLPDDAVEALRVTGTTHLVVVSGQNVAMILGVAIALLTLLMSRRKAALLVLVLLPPYVVLVGADPPVVRASIMAVGVALASVGGRRTPGWIYLAYAVALMLAFDPGLVRDAAFQLSATATVGVIVLAPLLRDHALAHLGWGERPVLAALVEVTATATGAAVLVLPVQTALFDRFSLWTVPANVIVAPLYEATLAVAVLCGLLGWIPLVADVVNTAGRFIPEAFLGIVHLMARLPAAEVPISAPVLGGLAFYAGLGAGTWWLSHRLAEAPALDPTRRSGLGWSVTLAIVAGGLWLAVLTPHAGLVEVVVLDVGQGLAVLVRDGEDTLLVDTGPPDGAVVRALSRAGVRGDLDAVLITHPDTDHAGGLSHLQRRMDVRLVAATVETLDALDATGGVPIDIGDRVRVGARIVVEVLSPPVNVRSSAHASSNDGSLVLLVTVGERRFLLTGDIEAPAEAWLVASGLDLRADVLVVPHHGSNSSSTPGFLAAVQPSAAVISAGVGNRYGHPHSAVLERYAGVEVFRTDEAGDIALRTDGARLWVKTER